VKRVALSPDAVVDEAARLVDEEGWEALHLGRLADRLGIKTPSLYKHVGGLPDLRRRLTLQGLAGFRDALGAAESVAELGHAYRAFARAHPGLYAATATAAARTQDDEELRAAADAAVAPLLRVVGDDVHAARAVRAALHGFVTLERAGGFGLPASVDESFDRLLRTLTP